MYNATEQIAELNKTHVAQASKLAALALANAEKLATTNLLMAKSALAQGIEGAQGVAAIKDVQQLVAMNTKLAEAGVRAALGYSTSLYEIATEAQAQVTALFEETRANYTKGAAAWIEHAGKSA